MNSHIVNSIFAFLIYLSPGTAQSSPNPSFETPEAAASAFREALTAGDAERLKQLLGSELFVKFSSGDPALDALSQDRLAKLLSEQSSITASADGTVVMALGKTRWPFPVPLTSEAIEQGVKAWRFNQKLGEEEVANRRIGANEIRAMRVVQHFIEAQKLYFSKDRDGDGFTEYARRFRSTPGRFDGLYWELEAAGPASPFAPAVGRALVVADGSQGGDALYHGYRFKILRQQGKNAPGGERRYLDAYGRMSEGVAILAYPSRYGVSGVKAFMASLDGVVYEGDLGPETGRKASEISSFEPGERWTKVDNSANAAP